MKSVLWLAAFLAACLVMAGVVFMLDQAELRADVQHCSRPDTGEFPGCGQEEDGRFHICECEGMYRAKWSKEEREKGMLSNCDQPEYKCRAYCKEDKCGCEEALARGGGN